MIMETTPAILSNFGARLRSVRTAKKISQEHLAALADLDRTYISLLERGLRNPSLECIGKLAFALDTTVKDLCDFDWSNKR